MKKIIKLCACASALVAGCGMLATKPNVEKVNAINSTEVSNFVAANTNGSFEFSAVNMPKKVDASKSEPFFIPTPSYTSAAGYKVKINVREGKTGNVYSYEVGSTAVDPFASGTGGVNFKYFRNATYEVYFTAENTDAKKIYSSSIYEVKVSGVDYSFDLDIKSAIPTIANVGEKILLPTLNVLDANGEVVEDSEVVPVVTSNTNTLDVTANGQLRLEGEKYYLYPTENVAYTISYKTADFDIAPQEININVTESFDSSKVVLDVETMTKSNIELGKEVTLPTPTVNDTFHNIDDVVCNYTIKVLDKKGNEVATLAQNTNKYTFEEIGTYQLEYTISNAYLNNIQTETALVKNVVVNDTIAPTVYMVKDYDTTAENWQQDIEKIESYVISSRVGYADKITLPAIYAEDIGTKNFSEFKSLKRVLVTPSGDEFDLAGDSNKEIKDFVIADFLKEKNEISAEADAKGNYVIEYTVIDDNGREGVLEVEIEVLGSANLAYTTDTNLTITLPTISNAMYSDEVKTVKVEAPKDDEDNNIETHYFYYYGNATKFSSVYEANLPQDATVAYLFDTVKTEFNTENNTNKLQELTCENNTLTLELKDYASSKGNLFTVVAIAINDQGQFVYATEEVAIKNTQDSVAPDVNKISAEMFKVEDFEFESNYVLGDVPEVKLPFVTFSDDLDSGLTISANYYIDDISNGLTGITKEVSFGNTIGGSISLTKAGTYYVIYTAVDDANNSYDFVTSFNVSKKTTYSIDVEYKSSLNVFESTEINAYVYDDEGNKISTDVAIEFSIGGKIDREGTEYTFNEAGNYVFVAKAVVNGKEISSGKLTITVSELEYKWKNESAIPGLVSKTHQVNDEVIIKVPSYTYGSKEYIADVKVVNPVGEEVETTDIVVNGVVTDVKFVAAEEGKYAITFTAGELEKTVYTQVGDNNPPTISISNKDSIPSEIAYGDENITLTLKKASSVVESTTTYNIYKVTLEASSEKAGKIFSRDLEVKLFDVNASGQQVALTWADAIENGSIKLNGKTSSTSGTTKFTWTISATGDYELTFIAEDTNEIESNKESIKFKVVEKSASKEKKDNKAGIILIVIAAILLFGIIGFFAFAGKSKSKKVKPVKVEDKKEDSEDNK